MQGCQFGAEDEQAVRGNAVGAAAVLGWEWLDPALLFQPGNGSVKRSRAQAGSAQLNNVFDHGVSVLRAADETGEHEQGRV